MSQFSLLLFCVFKSFCLFATLIAAMCDTIYFFGFQNKRVQFFEEGEFVNDKDEIKGKILLTP